MNDMLTTWIMRLRPAFVAIATTVPLWLSGMNQSAWAETACGDIEPEASYRLETGWIYICPLDEGLTYIGPGIDPNIDAQEINPDPIVRLPALPWGDGYQAIDDDVIYRVNGDEFQILQISSQQVRLGEVVEAIDAHETDTDETRLVGHIWQLQSIRYNNDELTTIDQPERYTVEFLPDGRASIQADCNRANGSYTEEGNSLTFSVDQMTRVACPPDSIADEYVTALESTTTYSIDGGTLYLDIAADVGTMEFSPATTSRSSLVGQSWQLQGVQYSNDELVTINEPNRYSLEFFQDSRVRVQADCNQASGIYTQEASQLSITLGPTTLADCAPDSFSEQYLQTLQSAAGYSIEDNSLNIDLKANSGTMVFVPAGRVISRADLCAIVSQLPDTENFGELLASLNVDVQDLVESQRVLRVVMEQLEAEGYGWQTILSGEVPDIQLQSWFLVALRLACEDQ